MYIPVEIAVSECVSVDAGSMQPWQRHCRQVVMSECVSEDECHCRVRMSECVSDSPCEQ